ncbi:jg7612 [Pararge aegeria aegeria]|uniref:Jg7612 protein n=1 Tax=Pararge aegeria aegeria TaxID=348720 RepID=A0A8S4REK0_9NEOP|nr:jg7612 [Pararge aegeria aegeria]
MAPMERESERHVREGQETPLRRQMPKAAACVNWRVRRLQSAPTTTFILGRYGRPQNQKSAPRASLPYITKEEKYLMSAPFECSYGLSGVFVLVVCTDTSISSL